MHISSRNVESHLDHIKGKLGCNSNQELIELLQIYSQLNIFS